MMWAPGFLSSWFVAGGGWGGVQGFGCRERVGFRAMGS